MKSVNDMYDVKKLIENDCHLNLDIIHFNLC